MDNYDELNIYKKKNIYECLSMLSKMIANALIISEFNARAFTHSNATINFRY